MFIEGFVQEVISDPSQYPFPEGDGDPPEGYLLKTDAISKEELELAPYNSLIVRITSGNTGNQEVLAYPMMQNHLAFPVKAGEHVWLININSRHHWLCRKNFNQQLDDVSLTVGGRFKQEGSVQTTADNATAAEGGGPNVLPKDDHPVISKAFEKDGEFKEFLEERQKHVTEPIPRYKKRPGDLVLQGSNNTLISLGSGGGHKKEEIDQGSESIHQAKNIQYSGTIDLVTGRGRHYPTTQTTQTSLGKKPQRTAAAVIESEFGQIEIDKNLTINNLKNQNKFEGDPDFGFDASRIYISTNASPDINFSLNDNYPKIPGVKLPPSDVGVIPGASEGAGIVMKSDHLRLIARHHIFSQHNFDAGTSADIDVNGSIRIIKEGTRETTTGMLHSTLDGQGASMISLEPDGTVMIDGSKIILGTGRETENGTGDHIFIGAGATEPIVLGNILASVLTEFWTALHEFIQKKFDLHTHAVGSGACSAPLPVFCKSDAGTGTAKTNIDTSKSKVGMTK
jgi:hypothetical protein